MPSILIVEDEDSLRKALKRFFKKKSYDVTVVSRGEDGVDLLKNKSFDILLADLMLPKISGLEVVRQALELDSETVAIVMTGFGTIPSAIEAIKAGAFHYITKPFELNDLFSLVSKGFENRKLKKENRYLRDELRKKFDMKHIVGKSLKMREALKLVERVAASDSTVLILGESGTGKELIAKAIHYQSSRSNAPMITVNCGAIPENLLETELFGHQKGSFTGATSNHIGRFEQADGGSIFLDEIGDMSPSLQVKVLRVLQDKKVQAVGSTKTRSINVRIITATNRDLEKDVRENHFREDLFYRLNVIPITLPPLRERREDVSMLLEHFLKRSNAANRKSVSGFSKEAMARLLQHEWPGNIRELENLVERLVVLKGKGEIELKNLSSSVFGAKGPEALFEMVSIPDEGVSFRNLMGKFEGTLIRRALEKSGGNKNKAALLLNLNRTTLIEKIKKKDLEQDREDDHESRG